MPATSARQWRFMKGVEGGSIPAPKGLSRDKAAEFAQGSPKDLPERAPGQKGKPPVKSAKKKKKKPSGMDLQRRRQMQRGPVKPPSRDMMEY